MSARTAEEIEAEVRRLSPWYYLFELGGVRTDITPSFDRHGHRRVDLPDALDPHLAGRTVLDVACNEGRYSFLALEHGAREVVGFDCRDINVEKARFVAAVKGFDRARFATGSVETWSGDPMDVVFLCGILYHLPEPLKVIEKYAALARETVFISSVLAGGAKDGWTSYREGESIGSSEDVGVRSLMPNTTDTLVAAFARHGFAPVLREESRWSSGLRFWKRRGTSGCRLLLRRT